MAGALGLATSVPVTVASMSTLILAYASLIVRWRQSVGVHRRQVGWVLLGLALTVALWAVGLFLGPVFTALAMVPLPVACLIAVLRHQLWNLNLVISRSLLYAGLTGGVALIYVACVGLLGGLLGRTTGAPLVATAIVAVCVEPLHQWLRRLVNRLVYGEQDDPFTVFTKVGQRLAGTRDAGSVVAEVLPEVVRSVAAAMRLPYVGIALAGGGMIEVGQPTAPVASIPLIYGGLAVGTLSYSY